ncbi:MAG TPA: hypothetical protein VIR31_00145 [Nitrososphaeraceae archaeon]
MEETYTFSRALHLMRYGGKNMECINSKNIYKIVDNHVMQKMVGGFTVTPYLRQHEIMGSWVEVKE